MWFHSITPIKVTLWTINGALEQCFEKQALVSLPLLSQMLADVRLQHDTWLIHVPIQILSSFSSVSACQCPENWMELDENSAGFGNITRGYFVNISTRNERDIAHYLDYLGKKSATYVTELLNSGYFSLLEQIQCSQHHWVRKMIWSKS